MCITLKSFTRVLFTFLCCILFFAADELLAQQINQAQLARQYFEQGEVDKARDIYEKLARDIANIPLIHNSYLELLLAQEDFDEAKKYLSKVNKSFPRNYHYKVDEALIYTHSDQQKEAEQKLDALIESIKSSPTLVRTTAQYLFQKGQAEKAVEFYLQGRKSAGNPSEFAIELANIYRRINNKDAMITEYLNFVNENPSNLTYVQNVMQSILKETEDLEALQQVLYDKIQKDADNVVYNELLIWVNMQLKDFYGAFIQARALDKRAKEGGKRLLDIGIMALHNQDYQNSETIFQYVIQSYNEGFNYEVARRYLIKAREELVKNTYPVDVAQIQNLIQDYDQLIRDLGLSSVSLEAMKSKALLHAFYLDEKDTAIRLLQKIIDRPRADAELVATAKLDLGDIYILMDQPWESTLLYGQVEKSAKETPIGHLAKLKNAKLSYYKGDFELAQSHLDVLKLATSREISNDAISLSLLIQNNIAFDTTEEAMRDYAAVDLILFQNKKSQALVHLDSMIVKYPGHSLTDEIWWRKANILLELGRFEESVTLLNQIVTQYSYDILSDDAYFLMGTVLEDYLNRPNEAMEIYQSLLVKYPGSLYTAEARQRYRSLRGDFIN